MSLRKVVLSDPELFDDGHSLFSRGDCQYAVHVLPRWMHIDIQPKAMKPLFGEVVVLERHSVEGHRSGPMDTRKIDGGSNLYVFARQHMYFRHVMSVVQHIASHH